MVNVKSQRGILVPSALGIVAAFLMYVFVNHLAVGDAILLSVYGGSVFVGVLFLTMRKPEPRRLMLLGTGGGVVVYGLLFIYNAFILSHTAATSVNWIVGAVATGGMTLLMAWLFLRMMSTPPRVVR